MSNQFLGEIRMFGGNFAPRNWTFCNGQILPISQNDALFALIGTTYGGDGQTTFALPNLQGRLPIGQGQGAGLSSRVIGELAGTESVTLINNNLPSHNHVHSVSSADATVNTINNTSLPGKIVTPATGHFYADNTGTPPVTFATLNAQSISTAGGNQPHDNMMPFLCVSFIIALAGIFPSRN